MSYIMLSRHLTRAKCQILFIVGSSLLLAACSSSKPLRSPTPVGSTPWFCEMNIDGESWDCVQDEARVRSPDPVRLPSKEVDPGPSATTAFITGGAGVSDQATVVTAEADVSAAVTAIVVETVAAIEASEVNASETDPSEIDSSEIDSSEIDNRTEQAPVDISTEAPETVASILTLDLLALPSEYYAVQLIAMPNQALADKFINEHPAIEPVTVTLVDADDLYHVVLLGVYENYQSALTAVENRPASLADIEPWIRSMSSVQTAMRDADEQSGTSE